MSPPLIGDAACTPLTLERCFDRSREASAALSYWAVRARNGALMVDLAGGMTFLGMHPGADLAGITKTKGGGYLAAWMREARAM